MSVVQIALGFIDACSEEEILQCREKALDAVRKLERVLGLPSRVLPSPRAETPSIDPLEKISERILDSIQKNLASILSLGRKKAKDALKQAPLFREDPRVLDARIYRGATKKTPKLMFRTSLAIRNISMDFAKFQTKKRGHSRVAEQVVWLTSNSDPTQDEATIDKFIEENHIVDSDTFKWMIISGTKTLVLEELFGSCGISSLLWRLPTWSKSLSYPALPVFLELFLHMPKYERIRRAAEDLTKWYEKCQRLYDKNITLQRAMFENLAGSVSDDYTVVSMDDDDTVVSSNAVWREDSLGHSVTSMTGDEPANGEDSTEGCIPTPALFEDTNVMGVQDICAVQEHQLHRFSPPSQSPVGHAHGSQTNNYRHHDLCRRQSANPDDISALPIRYPLGTELLQPRELVDLLNSPIHPVNFVDSIDTPIHSTAITDVMGCPTLPAEQGDFFSRPTQESVRSNYNSTRLPTLEAALISAETEYARATSTLPRLPPEMNSYAYPTADANISLSQGNFANYPASTNPQLFANQFRVPQACL